MITLTFINHDGSSLEAETNAGKSLMQAAVDNGVEGIIAECGGSGSCGTCHCYIENEWRERVGVADEMEETMLECVNLPRPESRLSCQIRLTEELDGLVVRLPESQF